MKTFVDETEQQQYLFDTSARHILRQGRQSIRQVDGMCVYRAANGDGCAAAPFITEYDSLMEGRGWVGLIHLFRANLAPETVGQSEFVSLLQVCHDHAGKGTFMVDWSRAMRDLAEKYGLSAAVLDEVPAVAA